MNLQSIEFNRLHRLLADYGQEHLLQFWADLDEGGRQQLASQLLAIDWASLQSSIREHVLAPSQASPPHPRLEPAPGWPAVAVSEQHKQVYRSAANHGGKLLEQGKVAAFTVAGGQGTRLGYDGPKGTFPISPVKGKSLFQWFAEGISRAREKYHCQIPWYIMTSPLNDQPVRDFFHQHDYFDLDRESIFFVTQGVMPAIGLDGRLLLAAPDSLALAPNGHGGSLPALRQSGALEDMAKRGIEYISYWQIDNPLVYMLDPLFIGLHAKGNSEMSSRGLVKTGPTEKLGNFCLSDQRLMVVEYSDMPDCLASKTRKNGELRFRLGSPAIHLINRSFVERLTRENSLCLPFHRALKIVPFIDRSGRRVTPSQPNAIKLETFIFDALPLAEHPLILEAVREEQFAPVKNLTGEDSVESCRSLLQQRNSRWLEQAGIPVPRRQDGTYDCVVELSPRSFLDQEDVKNRKNRITPPRRGYKEYYE